MNIRAFTLRLDPETGLFDDAEMRSFLEGRDVLEIHQHMVSDGASPVWALLIRYREARKEGALRDGRGPRNDSTPKTDWRALLSPEERVRYDALRRWRNDRSKKEGRPAYSLFNNEHLAAIARNLPTSPSALREIEGVGDTRIRQYGAEVVNLLKSLVGAPTEAASVKSEAPTAESAKAGDESRDADARGSDDRAP